MLVLNSLEQVRPEQVSTSQDRKERNKAGQDAPVRKFEYTQEETTKQRHRTINSLK